MQVLKVLNLQAGNRLPEPFRAPEINGLFELPPDMRSGAYHEHVAELRGEIERLRAAVGQLEQEIGRLNAAGVLAMETQQGLAAAAGAGGLAISKALPGLVQRIAGRVGEAFHFKIFSLRPQGGAVSAPHGVSAPVDAPLLRETLVVTGRRRRVAAPFRRYESEFRLALAARVIVWLVLLVFLLTAWRLWHAFSSTPLETTAFAGLFLLLWGVEQDAPRKFCWQGAAPPGE